MEHEVRYCTTEDGVRIAYAVAGTGPPLVWVPGWLSHLELDLEFPPFRGRVENLAEDFTLIRFDKRGSGVSQRQISDFSLDAHVLDTEAVVKALKLEKFALAGYSEGGTISIAYTTRHLDAVTHLILMGTWATAARVAGGPEMFGALVSIVRHEWGLGSKLLADLFFGEDSDPTIQRAFSDYQQQAATATDALASVEGLREFDVTALLPRVSVPTLVLHARADRVSPIEGGQEIAAAIPGARFISIEGHHVPNRRAMAQMDEAIREFVLGSAPDRGDTAASSGLVAVLFTDLVGHTEMMSRLGDERGRAVLREHEEITRKVLKQHGGTEVKTMGDGFMASFGSVTKAVECAIALQKAFAEREGEPLAVRVGLNAGEPIEEDGDLFGATVILASRIAAKADGGGILVADTVRGLCSGKGFLFADRGEFVAKGFEEPVRVYEVSWRD